MPTRRIVRNHYLTRRPNRTRREAPGGAARGKVGQGGYGCVYRPPFAVKPSKSGDAPARKSWGGYVTKIFINNDEAMEEIEENQVVNKMDPKYGWHLRNYGPYVLDATGAKVRKEVAACTILPRAGKTGSKSGAHVNSNTRLAIQYEDGGTSMYEAAGFTEASIAGLARLCKGVRDMAARSYCHLDIKSPNIVYSSKTKRFNFIDFGFGTPSREIVDTKRFLIGTTYFVIPMDFMYVAHALERKGGKAASLEKHVAAISKRINAGVRGGSLDIISQTIAIGGAARGRSVYNPHDDVVKHNAVYLDKCAGVGKTAYDQANAIVEAVKDRVDVFGLGLAFMDLFAKLYPGERISMPEHFYMDMNAEQKAEYGRYSGPLKERFGKLICKMCNPRIERRVRAKQLPKEFAAMLKGAGGKRNRGTRKSASRNTNVRRRTRRT